MRQLQITIIGGFLFNCKLFEKLNVFNLPFNYIDINNLLKAPFSFAEMCAAIIAQLSPDAEHILIAYSSGGLFALKLFSEQTIIIKQLILINSTPKFLQDNNWQGIEAKHFINLKSRLESSSLKRFQEYFLQLALYPQRNNLAEFACYISDTSRENLTALLNILAETDLRQLFIVKPIFDNFNKMQLILSDKDLLVPINKYQFPVNLYLLNNSTHFGLNLPQLISIIKKILCKD